MDKAKKSAEKDIKAFLKEEGRSFISWDLFMYSTDDI